MQPRAKLLYPFFSLPIPHAGSKISRSSREGLSGRHLAEYLEPKRVQKLLLLGHEGSGRSTVFKQVSEGLWSISFWSDKLFNEYLVVGMA